MWFIGIAGIVGGTPSTSRQPLDDLNRRLLSELHDDPRMSMSELGRRVGMSAPAVSERVQRMRDLGVIRGFRMELDPAALGFPVTAIVRVRPTGGQLDKLMQLARDTTTITECYRVTGEDCLVFALHAPTVADIETTLDRFLRFGQTVSSIVVSTPVPSRPLPLLP